MQQVIEERLEHEECTADDRAFRRSITSNGMSNSHKSNTNTKLFTDEYIASMKQEILENDEVTIQADGTIMNQPNTNTNNTNSSNKLVNESQYTINNDTNDNSTIGLKGVKGVKGRMSVVWIYMIKTLVSCGVMEYRIPIEQVEA